MYHACTAQSIQTLTIFRARRQGDFMDEIRDYIIAEFKEVPEDDIKLNDKEKK